MVGHADRTHDSRFPLAAGILVFLGILLSGPVGIGLVQIVGPQPPWNGVATFVASYHPIQVVPYCFGLGLIVGGAMMAISLAERRDSPPARARLSLVFTSMFATFISLNYVVQTALVPALTREPRSASAGLIEALTMSNPRSLGWTLELWGYGFLGVALWLVGNDLGAGRLGRSISWLIRINGLVSLIGAASTLVDVDWVLRPVGLASFAAWNGLMLLLAASFIELARRDRRVSGRGYAGAESPNDGPARALRHSVEGPAAH